MVCVKLDDKKATVLHTFREVKVLWVTIRITIIVLVPPPLMPWITIYDIA